MEKATLIIVILIAFIASGCGQNNTNANNHENHKSEVKEVFDSTYYFMLKNAYENKDTTLLNLFFEKWCEASLKMEMKNESRIAKVLNDIYLEIYHPFNYKKYGWSARPHYSKYKYAILPTEIKFKIINFDSINKEEFWFDFEMDTLKQFYPNPNLGRAGRLLDIDPFKKSMELFLEKNSSTKHRFLDSYNHINMPICCNWKDYRTTPEVYYVLINEPLNKAIAYLLIESTGVTIELFFKNNKWNIEKVNQIWIAD